MVERELVDCIDIVTKQADDPLERADVANVIDVLVEVGHLVLPLICFLESSLQPDRLRRLAAGQSLVKDIVVTTLGDVPHYLLLKALVGAALLNGDLVSGGLAGRVKRDVPKVVFV